MSLSTKYLVKYSFYLNGKIAPAGFYITEQEYEQACAEGVSDRVVVEGFFPPSQKSIEQLQDEIALLEQTLAEKLATQEAEKAENQPEGKFDFDKVEKGQGKASKKL